jgi:hypothetical protein
MRAFDLSVVEFQAAKVWTPTLPVCLAQKRRYGRLGRVGHPEKIRA